MNKLKTLLCTLLLLCGLALPIAAQNVPSTSVYEDHGAYSINLADLSVIVRADIRSKSDLIPVSIKASSVANQFTSTQGAYITPTIPQLLAYSFPIAGAASTQNTTICGTGVTQYSAWVITTGDGTTHTTVPASGSPTAIASSGTTCSTADMTAVSNDGSGLTLIASNSPKAVTVYGPSGDKLVTGFPTSGGGIDPLGTYYDANGNSMVTTSSTVADSQGLTVVTATGTSYEWTDIRGATQSLGISVTPQFYMKTAFGCGGPYGDNPYPIAAKLLTGISYPDGTSLSNISYEQTPGFGSTYTTGRILGLTLPTGGSVSFTYSGFDCAHGQVTTFKRITSDGTWKYVWAATSTGNTTTVTDPAGNVVVYTFIQGQIGTGVPVIKVPLLLSKVVNQGASTALVTNSYCYNAMGTCNGLVTMPVTQLDSYTTLAGMATSSHTKSTFDTSGNMLTNTTYGFGTASENFVTTIVYGNYGRLGCTAIGNYIVNKPCEISVTNSASNITSFKSFVYDAKGNLTSSTTATGGAPLTVLATYNTNGTTATVTSATGVVTSYTYGACGGAFPTQVTNGGINSYATWNCDGGVETSSTDANGAVIEYGYTNPSGSSADPFWRVLSVTDPVGTVTRTAYTSNAVETTVSFGSSLEDTIATVDGYARPIRTQTKQGSSYATVSTNYNVAAAKRSTSIPCPAALGSDCTTGFTTETMDGDSRATSTVSGGGATLTTAFVKQDATSTEGPPPAGEHSKVSQNESDGIGRVLSTCAIMATGGSSCGQVAGGTGILTTLQYSTASYSSTVTATRGSETKIDKKDGAGRTVSVTTPEKGTVLSYYDAPLSGDCYSIAAPGLLNETVDNAGIKTCYYYGSDGSMRLSAIQAGFGMASEMCRNFAYDSIANAVATGLTQPTGYVASNTVGRIIAASTNTHCINPTLTTEWFAYDPEGHVTDVWESTPHSGGYFHTTVSYAANGLPLMLSGIPGYPNFTYGLDADGSWNTAMEGTLALVASVTPGPTGVVNIQVGSGTDGDAYVYSPTTGQMTSFTFYVGSQTMAGTLNWNTDGQLGSLALTDGFNAGGTQTDTFVYDDVARITSDTATGTSGWGQTFSYDQYNNLTKAGSSAWNPGYNTKNQYANGSTYDANGNVLHDQVQYYTWEVFNKMASSAGNPPVCGTSGTCYIYDAFGRMVEKSINAAYTEVLYSPLGKTSEVDSSGVTQYSYVPMPGGGTAYFTGAAGTNHSYYHKDWLGSVRIGSSITGTGNGVVSFDRAFAPYGEKYASFGSGNPLTNFTGDTQEFTTWLSDTPNRELNTGQGRWESPDPSGSSWNAYAYVTDPNAQTDPTGLYGVEFGQFEVEDDGVDNGDDQNPNLQPPPAGSCGNAALVTPCGVKMEDGPGLTYQHGYSPTDMITGGFWGPGGVAGSDKAFTLLLGTFNAPQAALAHAACGGGRLCNVGVGIAVGVAMGGVQGLAGGISSGVESLALDTAPVANSITNFRNIFNTNATFIRGIAPDASPVGLYHASPSVFSEGTESGSMLFSQYKGTADGMWRISNHWGDMTKLGSTKWFLNDMTGGVYDAASGLWWFDSPVAAFVRYVDMVPRY